MLVTKECDICGDRCIAEKHNLTLCNGCGYGTMYVVVCEE